MTDPAEWEFHTYFSEEGGGAGYRSDGTLGSGGGTIDFTEGQFNLAEAFFDLELPTGKDSWERPEDIPAIDYYPIQNGGITPGGAATIGLERIKLSHVNQIFEPETGGSFQGLGAAKAHVRFVRAFPSEESEVITYLAFGGNVDGTTVEESASVEVHFEPGETEGVIEITGSVSGLHQIEKVLVVNPGSGKYVDLLPVEILVPELSSVREILRDSSNNIKWKTAQELKVAQWDPHDVWDLSTTMTHFALPDLDKDRDQFIVRIPGLNLNETDYVSVFIETTDSDEPDRYNDNPTEVVLAWDNKIKGFQSKSMCLVSDTFDDRFDGETVGDDDQVDDRTHIVDLGGNVKISKIIINSEESDCDLTLPVRVKKILEISAIVLRDGEGNPVIGKYSVLEDFRIARERYAQIGVDIRLKGDVQFVDQPDGVDISDGIDDTGILLPSPEKRALLENLTTADPNDLEVLYLGPSADGAAGWAEWTGGFNESDFHYTGGANSEYLNNIYMWAPYPPVGMVLSHEIAHILLKAGYHPNQGVGVSILAEHDVDSYDLRNADKGKRIGKETNGGAYFGTVVPDLGAIMLENPLLADPSSE